MVHSEMIGKQQVIKLILLVISRKASFRLRHFSASSVVAMVTVILINMTL